MRRLLLQIALLGLSTAVGGSLASAQPSPRVVELPADVTTNVGGAASFRILIEADSGVSYQWFHDDQPLAASTAATLVIAHVTSADSGRYQVVARTAIGRFAEAVATLAVKPPPAVPIVDPTFHGDAALIGTPSLVLPLPDRRVLLATTTVAPFEVHADLCRLLPDGRIDPAFRVGRAMSEEFPRNIGGVVYPPDNPVIRQLLVQPDGRVIVLGSFAFFHGVASAGIVRLKTDGTLDESFVPSINASNLATFAAYSSETVSALQPDGKILLLASSPSQGTRLVRLEADGRVDATFAAAGVPATATALALDRGGRIWIGSGNPRGPGDSGRVMALLRDGQIDTTFAPFACDPVLRLYALDNGSVVATTQYDRGPIFPGGPITGPRFPATTFRLRSDGSRDPAFATRATVLTTSPAPDGTVFLAGKLIAPDGITETTPNLGVPSQDQSVNSFTLGSDGRLWVTGTFSFYNGVNSSRIARLNLVATENLAAPRALAAWADKSVVRLYEKVTLHVAPVGDGPLTYTWLWPFNSGVVTVTNEPILEIAGSTAGESIAYAVRVANSTGAATSQPVTITNEPADLGIDWQPRRVSLASGRRGAMFVRLTAGSQADFAEWRRDGEVLRPDVNGRAGSIERVEGASILFGTVESVHAGTYIVTLRNKLGQSVTSDPITVTVGDSSRFTNLSTRATIGPGEKSAILGFIIPPGQSRTVLLRGIGPGLASFGITGVLADPRLDLFDSSGRALQRNNGWQVLFTGNGEFEKTGAFALASGSRDTALTHELQPGSYTVRLASLGDASGVGLIELYEDDNASDRLLNLSSRVFVAGGASGAAIAGFAIRGPVDKRMLVRAAGPALAALGLEGPLTDPQLEIRNEQGTLIATNDDWQTQPNPAAIAAAAAGAGAFPYASGSKDAALLLQLAPGNYSAVVASKDASGGTALIEIYEIP